MGISRAAFISDRNHRIEEMQRAGDGPEIEADDFAEYVRVVK